MTPEPAALPPVCLSVSLLQGLRPCLDEAVPGPVLEAHPAAQRGILSQVSSRRRRVQTLAESLTHRSVKLNSRWLSQQSAACFSSIISRIEAVTDTGQMGSVIRLKQFLEVRRRPLPLKKIFIKNYKYKTL